jgi:Ca2+-binding EF-hand superfamily protein
VEPSEDCRLTGCCWYLSAARLGELERQDRAQKLKIEHLQESAQAQHASLLALQKTAHQLREEKDQLERALDELRLRCQQSEAGAQLLTDKMKIYSGDDGMDLEELERALTLVRRRAETGQTLDFLESVDGEPETVPALRRKVQVLQVSNLNLTRELDRAERMLKAQTAIAHDLHLEIEDLSKRSSADRKDLQHKLEAFEALALKRLQRLHYLEAQIKQYRYNIHRPYASAAGDRPLLPGTKGGAGGEPEALMDEVAAGDFGPDENLLEVWVVAAELMPGVLAMGASSFVILDFFDYESQVTPFVMGTSPKYDFATTYKLTIDDFFLTYMATESLLIEVNQAHHLDYDILARAEVPLHKLLESRPTIVLPKQPLISVKDGSVVGTVHVEVRLALPVSEVYKLFLERHPEDRARIERTIEAQAKGKQGMAKFIEDSVRLQNEVEITVVQASGLPKRPGSTVAPCPYVHYQLLGFQDVFTDVADQGTTANFAHTSTFPVTTDPKLMRFLHRYRLSFTVIDFLNEDGEEESKGLSAAEGLIGKAEVALAKLADGDNIVDALEVHDENGKKVGTIRVSIKWRFPLKTGRNTGPNALLAAEVTEILSRFSPQRDGLVRYKDFVRYCDPPASVREALRKARQFLTKAEQAKGLEPRAVLDHLSTGGELSGVSRDAFVAGLEALNMGLAPDEMVDLFKYLDAKGLGQVGFDTIVGFLAPPSNLMEGILEKVRHRFEEWTGKGLVPMGAFEQVDEDKTGKLTRLQFKEVLVDLGFVLVDEPPASGAGGRGASRGGDVEDEHGHGDEMRPTKDSDWEGARRGSVSKAEELRRRRGEFERRIKAVEDEAARAALYHTGPGFDDTEELDEDGGKKKKEPSALTQLLAEKGLTETTRGAETGFIKDTGARPGRFGNEEEAAVAIQKTMRGYQHRKTLRQTSSVESMADGDDDLGVSMPFGGTGTLGFSLGAGHPLITAEDALYKCIKATHGMAAPPDLKKTFLSLDREGKGTVNRKQFAHAIRQHPALLPLSPQNIRTLMDYFDTHPNKDGTAIDYKAFCIFAEYRPPDLHPAIANIRKMVLHSGALEAFRAYDPDGVGLISVVDFLEGLRTLGYGYLGASVLKAMVFVFDFREVLATGGVSLAGVDYGNFVEYVLEQEGSLRLREAEDKLRGIIRGVEISAGDLRAAFAKLDVMDSGAVTQAQFGEALGSLGISLPEEDRRVLFYRVDARQTGVVHYNDFVSFVELTPSPRPLNPPHADFDEEALQAKGANMLVDCTNRGMHVAAFGKAFSHYDWHNTGKVPAWAFLRACNRAGLPYTLREVQQIARHFATASPVGDEFPVSFRKFLGWLMTERGEGVSVKTLVREDFLTGETKAAEVGDVAISLGKLRELRKKWVRDGVDYRYIMERYDESLKGALPRAEFAKALNELEAGLSDGEVLALAKRFNTHGDVAYLQFLHTIRRDAGGADEDGGVGELEEQLRGMIRRRFQYWTPGKLREPFKHFSQGRKTGFSEADFAEGMRELGFTPPAEVEQALFKRMDLDNRGKVSYMAFITFVRDPNYHDVELKLAKRIRKLKIGVKEVRRALETSSKDQDPACLSYREFRRALEKVALELPGRDVERISGRYDAKDDRHVGIEAFLRFVKEFEDHESADDEEDSAKALTPAQVEKVVKRLGKLVKAGAEKGLAPDKAFQHFDKSGTGAVDEEDFLDGMDRLGITLTPIEGRQVMKALGAKRSQAGILLLEAGGFKKALGLEEKKKEEAPPKPKPDADYEAASEDLQTQLKKRPRSLKELKEALSDLDKNKKGKVTREDMRFALDQADLELSHKHVRALMDK